MNYYKEKCRFKFTSSASINNIGYNTTDFTLNFNFCCYTTLLLT